MKRPPLDRCTIGLSVGAFASDDGALAFWVCNHRGVDSPMASPPDALWLSTVDVLAPERAELLATWRLPFKPTLLAACSSTRLVALATDGQLHLFDVGTSRPVGKPLVLADKALWIGLAPGLLAVITTAGLRVFSWEGRLPTGWLPDAMIDPRLGEHVAGSAHASLAGGSLAVRARRGVIVLRLTDLVQQQLGDELAHDVELVRLGSGGRRLLAGYSNGALVQWHCRDGRFIDSDGKS